MTNDPFAVLGLDDSASATDVRAARRRLAKDHHPDVGGDPDRMRVVNAAMAAALATIEARRGGRPAPGRGHTGTAATAGTAGSRTGSTVEPGAPGAVHHTVVGDHGRRMVHDSASFTIEALPAEAFEALLVAASWIGETLVDDPPYLLEAHVTESAATATAPPGCWCRLELVPDAGSCTVSLTVAPVEVGPMPDVDAIRDVWVAALNGLDWDSLADEGRRPPLS